MRIAHENTIPCVVCEKMPSDACHIKTHGSGGSKEPHNIVRMCREHHTMQHKIGWVEMHDRFPLLKRELDFKGWEVQTIFGVRKLVRKDAI